MNSLDGLDNQFQSAVLLGGCSGTIVSHQFVLTAAHCVANFYFDASHIDTPNVVEKLKQDELTDNHTIHRYYWEFKNDNLASIRYKNGGQKIPVKERFLPNLEDYVPGKVGLRDPYKLEKYTDLALLKFATGTFPPERISQPIFRSDILADPDLRPGTVDKREYLGLIVGFGLSDDGTGGFKHYGFNKFKERIGDTDIDSGPVSFIYRGVSRPGMIQNPGRPNEYLVDLGAEVSIAPGDSGSGLYLLDHQALDIDPSMSGPEIFSKALNIAPEVIAANSRIIGVNTHGNAKVGGSDLKAMSIAQGIYSSFADNFFHSAGLLPYEKLPPTPENIIGSYIRMPHVASSRDSKFVLVSLPGPCLQHPVIIAKATLVEEIHAGQVRIRAVSCVNGHTQFEAQYRRFENITQRGSDAVDLAFIGIESGFHQLEDGSLIEARNLHVSGEQNQEISLAQSFVGRDILLLSTARADLESHARVTRHKLLSGQNPVVSLNLQASEKKRKDNAVTQSFVGLLAIAPVAESQLVPSLATSVTHAHKVLSEPNLDLANRSIFCDMQTMLGMDTSICGIKLQSTEKIKVNILEETSKDSETNHVAEQVKILVLPGDSGLLRRLQN